MKYVILFCSLAAIVTCFGCHTKPVINKEASLATPVTPLGNIEIFDSSALTAIDSTAKIEFIAGNFNWSEGPVWLAQKQVLLFSDVPENKIFQWKEGDSAKLFLTPSGYTDTVKREGEIGSNGLTLDNNGTLLLCQSGNRVVARLNSSLDAPAPVFTVISANYKGKKFNSPNDLVADKNSNIYFTDPIYGLPQGATDPSRELNFEGVYRINTDGKTQLLIDSISRPNGIALSLDEKILYVASSDDQHPRWYAYKLDDKGAIKSGGILFDGTMAKQKAIVKQGADGMKIDKWGNIFSAGPDGLNIISPDGKLLALIRIYGRRASNCAFNETKDILFITADDMVLKVKLHGI
ncbi:SMP-30/gluconolactonase/LRE family protein [Flavihumibacter profundi]|uniref:SMP-30/gluconolactonase/LRE family protein n=1 Tax=Flavihumibacter profundi TaxID=2716883 RepID=UPI001CC7AED8|nr:SMP-30/gluconolactonase/LRE family protein [Flavihumibacter profundi]MBZ5856624.1 SMP-30/gluconolactonase/LRE family protein [Flavihumibacter profundi]